MKVCDFAWSKQCWRWKIWSEIQSVWVFSQSRVTQGGSIWEMDNLPQRLIKLCPWSVSYIAVCEKYTHISLLSVNTAVVVRFSWTTQTLLFTSLSILLMFSNVWLKLLYVDLCYIIKTLYWWILFTPFYLLIDFMYLPWSFRPKSLMCPVIYSFTLPQLLLGSFSVMHLSKSVCVCVLGENWNTAGRRQRVQECCRVEEWNRDRRTEKENWYLDFGSVWCHEMPAVLVAAGGIPGAFVT